MSRVSLQEQIASVAREIELREKLYPRWIVERKLSQQKSDFEIGAMKAVLATLIGLQAAGSLRDEQ